MQQQASGYRVVTYPHNARREKTGSEHTRPNIIQECRVASIIKVAGMADFAAQVCSLMMEVVKIVHS